MFEELPIRGLEATFDGPKWLPKTCPPFIKLARHGGWYVVGQLATPICGCECRKPKSCRRSHIINSPARAMDLILTLSLKLPCTQHLMPPMGIAWILTAVRRKRWSYGFKIRWFIRTFCFGCDLSGTIGYQAFRPADER